MNDLLARPVLIVALAASALIAGCGRDATLPRPAAAVAATEEAIARVGDVTIRASVLPTAALSAEIARQYGIVRDERTVMLLVGVRQGAEAQETALPARITATATRLGGQPEPIAMRELRTADGSASGQDLLDYVGTVEVSMPDTVRFDLTIVRENGEASAMRFSREFHPR